MRNLFQPDAVDELKQRVAHLRPDSSRQWGKMTPGQALAHYSAQLEMILGKTFPPRSWMGRLLGRFAKPKMLGESPLQKNMPTDELFVISDDRDPPSRTSPIGPKRYAKMDLYVVPRMT